MIRFVLRPLAWTFVLICSLALAACRGEDHNNMDHGKDSGAPK